MEAADDPRRTGRTRPASLWQLTVAFNQISLFSFGGGLSAWARRVLVEQRGWLTDVEFLSAQTLCRVLPGANQVNMAVYVGTRFGGAAGAVAAVLGIVAVPFGLLMTLAAIYFRSSHLPEVKAVLSGVAPVAIAMSASTAWKAGRSCLTGPIPVGLALAMLVLTAGLRVPLMGALAILGPPAVWWAWPRDAAAEAEG